jgi:hypothetical protein
LYEYERKGVIKKASCKLLILRDAILVVFGLTRAGMGGLEKEK